MNGKTRDTKSKTVDDGFGFHAPESTFVEQQAVLGVGIQSDDMPFAAGVEITLMPQAGLFMLRLSQRGVPCSLPVTTLTRFHCAGRQPGPGEIGVGAVLPERRAVRCLRADAESALSVHSIKHVGKVWLRVTANDRSPSAGLKSE